MIFFHRKKRMQNNIDLDFKLSLHKKYLDSQGWGGERLYLAYVDLTKISFRDIDLRYSSFHCANLEGADFRGAIITGADFRGAKNIDKAKGLKKGILFKKSRINKEGIGI